MLTLLVLVEHPQELTTVVVEEDIVEFLQAIFPPPHIHLKDTILLVLKIHLPVEIQNMLLLLC